MTSTHTRPANDTPDLKFGEVTPRTWFEEGGHPRQAWTVTVEGSTHATTFWFSNPEGAERFRQRGHAPGFY